MSFLQARCQHEMAVYDLLPASIRDVLKYTATPFNSLDILCILAVLDEGDAAFRIFELDRQRLFLALRR